jgi:hypothetical protein
MAFFHLFHGYTVVEDDGEVAHNHKTLAKKIKGARRFTADRFPVNPESVTPSPKTLLTKSARSLLNEKNNHKERLSEESF